MLALVVAVMASNSSCGGSDGDGDGGGGGSAGEGGVGGAGGSGGEAQDVEGLEMCCVLGAVCHRTGGGAPDEVDDCHDLGHLNDPAQCREAYDGCLEACGAGGEGGAGGDPVRHACVE